MACELLPLQEVVFPLVSTLRSDVSRRLTAVSQTH